MSMTDNEKLKRMFEEARIGRDTLIGPAKQERNFDRQL